MLNVALIVLPVFLSKTVAFECSIPPIYIDIHTRQVQGSDALSYGSWIAVGDPVQNQSLWPLLGHNETTLADVAFCASASSPTCSSNSHGFFNPDQSTSWRSNPQYQSLDNDSVLTDSDSTILQTGTDTLYLYQHFIEDTPDITDIESFPTTILSNYTSNQDPFFGPAGTVGIGPSSTLLQRLYSAGEIASRSFGLYLGTAYSHAGGAVNGSLTFGGYDAARFTNPVHSYTMSPNDPTGGPLKVHVAQIAIVGASKPVVTSHLNLINDTGFDAYITTSQYVLTLPHSLTVALASILSATPSNNSLAIPSGFTGNITITLSGGLRISFPSEWVANPTSNISPFSASPLTSEAEGPFLLGAAFLSYTYLAADYDASPPTFYLAPATLDALFIHPATLCPGTAPAMIQSDRISSFVRNGLIGVIIGGVIGGSALTVLAFCLIRSCLRQRERKQVVRFVNLAKGATAMEDVELGGLKRSTVDYGGNMKTMPKKLTLVTQFEKPQRQRSILKKREKIGVAVEVKPIEDVFTGKEDHRWPWNKRGR